MCVDDAAPNETSDPAGSGHANGTGEPRPPRPSLWEQISRTHEERRRRSAEAHARAAAAYAGLKAASEPAPPAPRAPQTDPHPSLPATGRRTRGPADCPGRVLRWLPARLVRLYRGLVAARPYARAPRVRPLPPEPPPTPCGRDRKLRLEIVQDAFCQHRPAPRLLFRAPVAPRDMRSWCDEPHRRTGRPRPICPSCAHARRLYAAACNGDAAAEGRLHTLARRGAVRLLAKRREYRHARSILLAAVREERARNGPEPTPPSFLDLQLWPHSRPSGPGAHHLHARRDVERDLLRDHARHLRHLTRQRRLVLAANRATKRPAGARQAPASRRRTAAFHSQSPGTAQRRPRPRRQGSRNRSQPRNARRPSGPSSASACSPSPSSRCRAASPPPAPGRGRARSASTRPVSSKTTVQRRTTPRSRANARANGRA